VQVLINLVDFGMNLQDAGEAARFRHVQNGIYVESAIASQSDVVFGLNRLGQRLLLGVDQWGGFQGIIRDPQTGILMGGSDPRKDGLAIGF
jgi:gamma-glutamyltranspeptidase/glutathione hydrolase